ncbi:MAG: GDP-mannose 4,6-dehydratase, partial [Pseudomonadales bacterium]|nr:GDP-mannose 4,6-dehydratase [Pseudomonadales bacterium]
TINTNLIGTLNLLQALKTADFRGAFLYVSSGDVYGLVEESDLPISESLQPQPRNPYAVSKVSAELLCQQWSYSEPDWRIMIARPFNHIGPGQNDSFLVPEIAKQLCLIKAGQQSPELQLGDIDVTRDFTDVRDVISAYFTILESGKSGEIYNICSGKERLVRDIILTMCELAGVDATITQDETRLRKSQQRRAVGDYGKLASNTGWQPIIELEESLRAILSDWEQRIHS